MEPGPQFAQSKWYSKSALSLQASMGKRRGDFGGVKGPLPDTTGPLPNYIRGVTYGTGRNFQSFMDNIGVKRTPRQRFGDN